MDILKKIEQAKLVGRGGACFPVATKWNYVKKAEGNKYIVANGAEGEPGVKKDGYILTHHTKEVINGINLALKFFKAKRVFIFLNHNYTNAESQIKKEIGKLPIEIIYKPQNAGYIAGEESALLSTLEKKRIEPSIRPPFPVESGYKQSPTLINNIETFYNISLVDKNKFSDKRFYTVGGDCYKPGVYCLPDNWSIARILEETNNFPRFKFFIQHGGRASGEVLNSTQLNQKVRGCGAITIYKQDSHDSFNFIKNIINFYAENSCGKCTPCREGSYRLKKMLSGTKMNWPHFLELIDNMEASSFCALGSSLALPVKSYLKNVNPDFNIQL